MKQKSKVQNEIFWCGGRAQRRHRFWYAATPLQKRHEAAIRSELTKCAWMTLENCCPDENENLGKGMIGSGIKPFPCRSFPCQFRLSE
jgi:hypothetical protein